VSISQSAAIRLSWRARGNETANESLIRISFKCVKNINEYGRSVRARKMLTDGANTVFFAAPRKSFQLAVVFYCQN